MPKNPISDKDLLKKDDYKSIMYLIDNYQYRDYKKVGLTAGQLLYALKKKNGKTMYDREVEKIFTRYNVATGKDIILADISSDKKIGDRYIFIKEIVRGCIKNSVQLNERLNTLRERGWITPVKGTKSGHYRYITTRKWMVDKPRRRLKNDIDRWNPDSIYEKMLFDSLFKNKTPLEDNNDKITYDFVLCGLSNEFFEKLDNKEKKQLINWIDQASNLLYKIIELKYEKMKISPRLFVKMKHEDISKLMSIGFYYNAYKNMVDPRK